MILFNEGFKQICSIFILLYRFCMLILIFVLQQWLYLNFNWNITENIFSVIKKPNERNKRIFFYLCKITKYEVLPTKYKIIYNISVKKNGFIKLSLLNLVFKLLLKYFFFNVMEVSRNYIVKIIRLKRFLLVNIGQW